MIPRPIALGLTLCDQIIVEKGTDKVSIIGQIQEIRLRSIPGDSKPFSVIAMLVGSEGVGVAQLEVIDLRDLAVRATATRQFRLIDRLTEYPLVFPISSCRFYHAGWYQFQLLVDGDPIAERRIRATTLAPGGSP